MKNLITFLIVVLMLTAVASQGVVIFISNTSRADSIDATKIARLIEKSQEENIDLESKILVKASYQAVSSRAAELGYKNVKEFVSVYDPIPLAIKR